MKFLGLCVVILSMTLPSFGAGESVTDKNEFEMLKKADLSSEIGLALSALSEVQAMNDGLLDARTGIFNPKVLAPGLTSETEVSLSKNRQ